MCGIIGYIGKREAVPILIEGLRRLEYRGYDSAGIAFFKGDIIEIRRCAGKISDLESAIPYNNAGSRIGIGHTRWATHGRPSEENAHPHRSGGVVVVHNGIIENYMGLKRELIADGYRFRSETDTEVIAHLIDRNLKGGMDIEEAVLSALREVKGTYAISILSEDAPDTIVAARNGCPLVIGVGDGEYFIASDIPAFLNHTRDVIFLEDGDVAILTKDRRKIVDLDGLAHERRSEGIAWSAAMAEKGGYKHFMLKEIHEQPDAIIHTISGRASGETGEIYLEEMRLSKEEIRGIRKVYIVACGTSWHAALVGKYMIEEMVGLPVEVDIGSEFRYRDPIISSHDLVVVISQSGETADTIAALKEASDKGGKVIAICNVVGSTIAREADGVMYTHAGPEIAVASTKAFTSQLVALYLLAIYIGEIRDGIPAEKGMALIEDLVRMPNLIEEILKREDEIVELSKSYFRCKDFLFLGRGINYPIALEGALKLKEISYIHAEGYPAGEMKHGPIALIDENMPVVVLAPRDRVYEKMANNIMEVKARDGIVIAFTTQEERGLSEADHIFYIPETGHLLAPILLTIPLQLLAYHIAVLRGLDVDQPRNLAKSVTVE